MLTSQLCKRHVLISRSSSVGFRVDWVQRYSTPTATRRSPPPLPIRQKL